MKSLRSDLRFTIISTELYINFQRLVSFMTDLRGADSLLQKAIRKVDESSKLDTAEV